MEGGQQSIENLKQNQPNAGFPWVEMEAKVHPENLWELHRAMVQDQSLQKSKDIYLLVYYGLNCYLPLNILMLKPSPQCDGIWK